MKSLKEKWAEQGWVWEPEEISPELDREACEAVEQFLKGWDREQAEAED